MFFGKLGTDSTRGALKDTRGGCAPRKKSQEAQRILAFLAGEMAMPVSRGQFFRMSVFQRVSVSAFDPNPMKIGIVGLGYVGLPLALQFARGGVEVIGFDIDPEKVKRLRACFENGKLHFIVIVQGLAVL